MAPRKPVRGKQEAQPILQERRNATLLEAGDDQLFAVAGLLVESLAQGDGLYVTAGRWGGINFKVYQDGEAYSEFVPISGDVDDLVEQLLDALYDQNVVAHYRARFGSGRAVRGADGRKKPSEG